MTAPPIDLWNAETFDPALTALLTANLDLIRAFVAEQKAIDAEYEADQRRPMRRSNPHWDALHALEQEIDALARDRTARGWHYSRLTDDEVAVIRANGLTVSTLAGLARRLNARVAAGDLTEAEAKAVYNASPLHEQGDSRLDQICFAAKPQRPTSAGVRRLLSLYGGEAASFHLEDSLLLARLETLGRPRIVEAAIPLATVRRSTPLGKAILGAFAARHNVRLDEVMPDLFAKQDLGAGTILAIHTEGEARFTAFSEAD